MAHTDLKLGEIAMQRGRDTHPVRPGPKTRKRYLLVACTCLLTYYFLGDRSMKTFTAFVLPDMGGTVVAHDRYQNYDAIPGLIHQLCTQHLLRDLADAAQRHPDAPWPVPAAEALQGLIHAANTARAQGLPALLGDIAAPLIHAFRHGILVGLAEVPRSPSASSGPAATCWLTCCDSLPTCASRRVCRLVTPPENQLSPGKIGGIAQAALVLVQFEHKMIT